MSRLVFGSALLLTAVLGLSAAAFAQCGTPPELNDPSPSLEEWTQWCNRYGHVVGSGANMRCEYNPNWCNAATPRRHFTPVQGAFIGAGLGLLAGAVQQQHQSLPSQRRVRTIAVPGGIGVRAYW